MTVVADDFLQRGLVPKATPAYNPPKGMEAWADSKWACNMAQQNEPSTKVVFDKRFDSYQSFFDHDWAARFGKLSDKSKLQLPAFDLTRDWKGIAVATRMPWLMVESVKSFHGGFTKTNPPFHTRLAKMFGEYVTNKSQLSNMRKKELVEIVGQLGADVQRDMARSGPAFDPQTLWQDYLGVSEFGLALWNAQRIAYGAIYYAYENFLQRVVAVGRRDESYRAMNIGELRNGLESLLGAALTLQSLDDPEIEIARLARNALTHDGGRISEKLRAKPHGITVEGDELQIMPHDTRRLFDLLKGRATEILETAASLPDFAI
jgi:hypothetical protein